MHSSQTSFLPGLDLNPPAAWSKPASALGLSNPLSHLSQSQQVKCLQQQIEHHRQLQRSSLQVRGGRTVGGNKGHLKIKRDPGKSALDSGRGGGRGGGQGNDNGPDHNSSADLNMGVGGGSSTMAYSSGFPHRHSFHFGSNDGGPPITHINIRNHDDDEDDDDEDHDKDNDGSSRGGSHGLSEANHENDGHDDDDGRIGGEFSYRRHGSGHPERFAQSPSEDEMQVDGSPISSHATLHHQHRAISYPQITQGFSVLPSLSAFGSASGPNPIPTVAMTASTLTSGLLAQSSHPSYRPPLLPTPHEFHPGQHPAHHRYSVHGNAVESSLASLAALSVMPATLNGMPFSSRRASSDHSVSSTSSSFSSPATLTTSTTSSLFQPQSLPVIFQNQVAGSGSNGNHNNGSNPLQLFATALGQQLQRQQQQQQQQSGAYNHVAPLTPALSASMPVHSTTHQPFPSFRPVSSPDLLPTLLRPDISSPFSQPTVYPLPSTSATAIAVDNKQEDKLKSKSSNTLVLPPPRALPPRPPQTSAPRRYLGRQMRKQPPSAKMLLSNPAKEPAVPSRRMAHIISEQKRREKINGGFDELKSVIPECAENTDSKATILRKAVDYILLLEDELRRYSECYQAEDEEFDETLATYKEEEEDEVYVQ